MSVTPLSRIRVDDLAKAIAVSTHVLPVECHVKYRPPGGSDSVRLELSVLNQHGYDLVVVVDECPAGSEVSDRARNRLDAYCAHFGADAGLTTGSALGTLLELLLECIKSFVKKSETPAVSGTVVHLSKPLLF
jgi:hypothetical protein